MSWVDVLIACGLLLLNTLWLLSVVLGLPGTWLMAGTALLVVWLRWDAATGWSSAMFGWVVLAAAIALALLGEAMEFFAGVSGAQRAGASRSGAVGAFLGAIAGAIAATFLIPVPIVGSLLGACGGAALGAGLGEVSAGRTFQDAQRSGVGAGVGRFKGTLAKVAVAAGIWLLLAVASFWP